MLRTSPVPFSKQTTENGPELTESGEGVQNGVGHISKASAALLAFLAAGRLRTPTAKQTHTHAYSKNEKVEGRGNTVNYEKKIKKVREALYKHVPPSSPSFSVAACVVILLCAALSKEVRANWRLVALLFQDFYRLSAQHSSADSSGYDSNNHRALNNSRCHLARGATYCELCNAD